MSCLVMGVVNVTPDSFSDGGRWFDPTAAVEHGLELVAEGADIIDVGGESTRPGAPPVDQAEELRRVIPVIEQLAPRVRVSVDTRKAAVAEAAVAAGATIVNDVSASLGHVAAGTGSGWIAMHMRGEPRTMQDDPVYEDVVAEVCAFLVERAEEGRAAGASEVWIDPGIGFGKTAAHNWSLIRHVRTFAATGFPVVIGASRKGFLGAVSGGAAADDRLEASLAVATWAMAEGAAIVRVHDVAATVQAARLVAEDVS
ncbi:MAG: dihydropteroate synthase [Acidimicrobiaceae bacterium]|jgi:dihydropteroate synthase|nr:dihydropteroate synthase [Acidimicrobiaceae bacterium]